MFFMFHEFMAFIHVHVGTSIYNLTTFAQCQIVLVAFQVVSCVNLAHEDSYGFFLFSRKYYIFISKYVRCNLVVFSWIILLIPSHVQLFSSFLSSNVYRPTCCLVYATAIFWEEIHLCLNSHCSLHVALLESSEKSSRSSCHLLTVIHCRIFIDWI